MIKRFLCLTFLVFGTVFGYSQAITVNTTSYTVPQLVTDVLFNPTTGSSSCVGTISNITWSTGTNFGSNPNGIGYFTNTNPNFPLTNGVVLSTGDVLLAEGPNDLDQSEGMNNWTGDADLFTWMTMTYGLNVTNYRNATKLEFDFVPMTNQMSFDFLFASEEYGFYQCNYSDAFAFFLENVTAGTPTTNLALVPGTSTPISVTTIRDDAYNDPLDTCTSSYPAYFDNYTDPTLASSANAPTNFNGTTVKMTASSAVIPNNTYHIKLVIADRNDNSMDSAVFLGGGSFNIGSETIVGNGMFPNGGNYTGQTNFSSANAICPDFPVTLSATTNPTAGSTYQWYMDGNLVSGATNLTETFANPNNAINPHIITVTITYPNGCQKTNTISAEWLPAMPIANPVDLYLSGSNVFNLNQNAATILNGQNPGDYDISFHHTLADAQNTANPILNPGSYVGNDGEIIYVAILDNVTGSACLATRSFVLHLSCPSINTPVGNQTLCLGSDPSVMTSSTTATGTDAVSFVYFTTQQTGTAMYTGGTLLSNVTPSSGTATLDMATLGSAGSLPNTMGTYWVYAILNPTPADATCRSYTEFQIVVNNSITAGTDGSTTICTTDTTLITLSNLITGEDTGGTWTTGLNPSGGTFTAAAGTFDPTGASAGTYTFIYTVAGTAPCVDDTATVTITVNRQPVAGTDGSTTICTTDTTLITLSNLITGEDTGGTWAAGPNPLGGTFTAAAGTFDPTGASAGTYTFIYTVAGTAPCVDDTATVTITVNQQLNAGTDGSTTICASNVTPIDLTTIVTIGDAGGVWTANTNNNPPGGTFDATTATFTPDGTSYGTYQFYYTVAGTAPCVDDVATATIIIHRLPNATITGNATVCLSDPAPVVTFTGSNGTAAYTFDYTIDGVVQTPLTTTAGTSATITLSGLTVGTHTVTLTHVTDANTCDQALNQTVTINVVNAPTLSALTPYEICDGRENDGFGVFDLNWYTNNVIQPAAGVQIGYYITQTDAETLHDPIINYYPTLNYPNVVQNTQTIYVSAYYTGSNCIATTTLQLVVNPMPTIGTLADYHECETTMGSNVAIFNLTTYATNSPELSAYSAAPYDINFYATQADAVPGNTNYITTPSAYTSATTSVWVLVENTTTGCFDVEELKLIVDPKPIIPVSGYYPQLETCDTGAPACIETFDLTTAIPTILNGQSGISVTFYPSLALAQAGVAGTEIANPSAYTNVDPCRQTLGVVLTNITTGCQSIATMDLYVNPQPVVLNPTTPLEICDDNNDGFGVFDLDTYGMEHVVGTTVPSGYTIAFYLTQSDAEQDDNEIIVNPYANITAYTQTIWVVVTDGLGCRTITTLNLVVHDKPIAGDPGDVHLCEQTMGSNTAVFNLTSLNTIIANGNTIPLHAISFYTTQADAIPGSTTNLIGTPATHTVTGTQTIWALLENTVTGCYDVQEFDLIVDPRPIVPASGFFPQLETCETGAPVGIETFDLTTAIPTILNGQSGINVTFYPSLALAQAGVAGTEISNPSAYPNTVAYTQTLGVVLTNVNTGCQSIATMDLYVNPQPVVLNPTTPLEICDDNNDGFGVFDLDTYGMEHVVGTTVPSGYTIAFYLTQSDAEQDDNEITTNPHANNTAYNDMVYAVVTDSLGCRTITTLNLIVHDKPIAGDPGDVHLCEQTMGSNTAVFNLTSLNTIIANGNTIPPHAISFYTTQADAIPGSTTNLIGTPATHTVTGTQTIWALLENTVTGCYDVQEFDLIVDPRPIVPASGFFPQLETCETGAPVGIETFDLTTAIPTILNGQSGINVTFYPSLALAQAGVAGTEISNPSAYPNTVAYTQTLGVVLTNVDTGCQSIATMDLYVNPQPVVLNPTTPLEICDDNNDGFGVFDLDTYGMEHVVGTTVPTGYTIAFYLTQSDAEQDDNEIIVNPYANITAYTQTIWVVVTDSLGCRTITTLNLIVHDKPITGDPGDVHLCEQTMGSNTAVFNLTSLNTIIANGNTIPPHAISFYTTQADAIPGSTTNLIGTPATHTVIGTQTIWALLENTVTGCYDVQEFDLIVDPRPIVPASGFFPQLETCETGAPVGIETFDLTTAIPTILNGQSGINVTFYPSLALAQAGVAGTEISNPSAYPNTVAYTQTLGVVLTNVNTGCQSIATMDLYVNPQPMTVLNPTTPMEECDDNNDGYAQFDLSLATVNVTGNTSVPYTISYYLTQSDAENNHNPLPTLYTNVQAYSQTIWAVVSNGTTTCKTITTLNLVVHDKPLAGDPGDTHLCEQTMGSNTAVFNLTSFDTVVANGYPMPPHAVSYYTTQAAAIPGNSSNAISAPATYTVTGTQTIWALLENTATGCYDVQEFDLIVDPRPIVPASGFFPQLETCETGAPVCVETFDLTTAIPTILGGQNGINVTFYPSYALAQAGAAGTEIANPSAYTNVDLCRQTLGVVLTNAVTGCKSYASMDIYINPQPIIQPITQLPVVCDDNQDGIGLVNLCDMNTQILGGAPASAYTISYHLTQTDADLGLNNLPCNYTNYQPFSEIIYVRIEDNVTGCYNTTSFKLAVKPAPIVPPSLTSLTECDVTGNTADGCTYFDLTQINAQILPLQTPPLSNYVITYHLNQTDAQIAPHGQNQIYYGSNGYYACDGDVIWVRIEDLTTGCANTISFTLATDVPLTLTTATQYNECDNDATPNDGFYEFDLAGFVGTMPSPYVVDFYYDMDHTIPISSLYTNTTQSTQTIHYTVTNTVTGCITPRTLTLVVVPVPSPRRTGVTPLVQCDNNSPNDGYEVFDLTQNATYILNGEQHAQLLYYTNEDDANEGGTTPTNGSYISTPTAANVNDDVYIRVQWDPSYYTSFTDTNGQPCYVVVTQPITVNPLPLVASQTIPYCETGTTGTPIIDLTAYNQTLLDATQQAQYPNCTFTYYELGSTTPISTPSAYQMTSNPQTFEVEITNTVTGCSNRNQFIINVNTKPTYTAPTPLVTCDTDTDGIITGYDLTQYDATILGGQPAPTYTVTYYESDPTVSPVPSPITTPTNYAIHTQTIWAVVTNTSTGCTNVGSINMVVEPLPTPIITASNNIICVDFTTGLPITNVTLTATNTTTYTYYTTPPTYTYQWYQDGVAISGATNDTYTIAGTLAGGIQSDFTVVMTTTTTGLTCNATSATPQTIYQSGPAVVIGTGYTVTDAFTENQVITVTVDGFGDYEFSLDDGPRQISNVFTNVSLGTHIITVWDVSSTNASCDPLVIELVQTIDYPHYFTPNGDGINDTWNIVGLSGTGAEIFIFDRFGKLIKQISPDSAGWDGTYNGEMLPATDYWFTVKYPENSSTKLFKAHFTMKR